MKRYDGVWDHYLDWTIEQMRQAGIDDPEPILQKLHTVNLVVEKRKNDLVPYDAPPGWFNEKV